MGQDLDVLTATLGDEAPISGIIWGLSPYYWPPQRLSSGHIFRGVVVGLRS